MKINGKRLHLKHSLGLLALSASLWMGTPAQAQVPGGTTDSDITRSELGKLDQFLDSHPETAEELRKDPSLINNREFMEKHDNLREFLEQNPGVREELRENPNAFMNREQRFDRRDDTRDRDFRDRDNRDRDNDRASVAKFDQFLDSHPETAEQLRKDPSLVNDREFLKSHQNLREFLEQNPGVREEVRDNPNAFMHQEQRFDRREDNRDRDFRDPDARNFRDNDNRDRDRESVAKFDQFLDSHPETAEQLRKDPSLVNNKEFIEKHDNLKEFLAQNPGVREEIRENPNAFMRQEQRFDQNSDYNRMGYRNDRDTTRGELASFDGFMDGHPEIAEQVRKNPTLVNNQEFVEKHPALHEYLQQHPGVRDEVSENPNAFMRQEQRFDRREDREMASFNEFLGGHSNVAQQLSRDPSLAKNEEYLESHPELQQYLKTHPGVQQQLAQNPQAVMKATQPAQTANPVTKPADTNPKKPKQ